MHIDYKCKMKGKRFCNVKYCLLPIYAYCTQTCMIYTQTIFVGLIPARPRCQTESTKGCYYKFC